MRVTPKGPVSTDCIKVPTDVANFPTRRRVYVEEGLAAAMALSRQCLDRRIESPELPEREVRAWEQERNAQPVRINWQFKTAHARIKLRRLYPQLSPTD